MPKQRDPDLDMLTEIELRLRDNREEMITLACAAVADALSPGYDVTEIRFSVQRIAKLMLTHDISRSFDAETSEWVLTLRRKPDPNQPELTSTQERSR